jgi:hypothetical protein
VDDTPDTLVDAQKPHIKKAVIDHVDDGSYWKVRHTKKREKGRDPGT